MIGAFKRNRGSSQSFAKECQPSTLKANLEVAKELPFSDRRDFEDATQGYIGSLSDEQIIGPDGGVVWCMKSYGFLEPETPANTVNPSLWRQAQLNAIHGLFKITDNVYQVRGLDISNMTIIEGNTSLIIIETLFTTETAQESLKLYYRHRPQKPVRTVIYTHSHSDHYGGVKGIVKEADVKSGEVQIIAPVGFMESVVAENILAGNAMHRRSQYQFGMLLSPSVRGHVDCGIGKAASHGTVTLIAPTIIIEEPVEERTIDGVDFVFQLAPGSEAPSEMLIYMPQQRVLNMAEDVTHHMHNLYALRGVEVRDGNQWAKYIDAARVAFGSKTDVLIAQHHWPTTGQMRINELLKKQRDMYKFIHDQTLRLLNQGYTSRDIAETLRMPSSLEQEWSTRGYYGTLSHNAKAVYQKYLGWYDANPANLNPLPPVAYAKKAVEYMGGPDAVLARAYKDFQKGEFRWVASVVNQLVFADPNNHQARELCADALEQLGYQAEASTWRNAYLVGAMELRQGVPKRRSTGKRNNIGVLNNEMFFDFLAVRLNATKAEGKIIVSNWCFINSNERFVITLENCALTYIQGWQTDADATIALKRTTFEALLANEITMVDFLRSKEVEIEGNRLRIEELLKLFDDFDQSFPVVEPMGGST
ncbi:AVB_G0047100.mRNA.1.CDS.1 [Saccharomyces cerevisiae]|nr:AVB_G0047100.mRNA.1.CDS.1 [Saccharomyces cerevisiae]CAI7316962.1 AVB_G0047100.mRNA.1.CDS.1 [Saccharomyces cerevisiae]